MLPEALLPCSARDGLLLPHFLHAGDHPWLEQLLELYAGAEGCQRRVLDSRLRGPLPFAAPFRKCRLAVAAMDRLCKARVRAPVPPAVARAAVFAAAADGQSRGACRAARPSQGHTGREPVRPADGPSAGESRRRRLLDEVAAELETTPDRLEASLFADLPGERVVEGPDERLSAGDLAARANLMLVQALLQRSTGLRLQLSGNSRRVVQQAKLKGLLCNVVEPGVARLPASRCDPAHAAVLEVSGPLALFRRTLLYGRALGELVPFLAWCHSFALEAEVLLRGQVARLRLSDGSALLPAAAPKPYDSLLEKRFARDFARLGPAWDLVREPEPVRAGHRLVFPDFALVHRHDPQRRWLVEIIGFWTPEYLARKLCCLREAGLANIILCVDETLNCGEADLPAAARVVRFRRRVDADAVLRLVES